MPEIYGKQIKWGTTLAPNPAGGICENYSYQETGESDDHPDNGVLAAVIHHNKMGNIRFGSKLTADALVPVLGNGGGCKIAITGLATGGILLSRVVETWGVQQARRLECEAGHYPDLGAGGSSAEADLTELAALTSQPICYPTGKVAWGLGGTKSALGIIQSLTITQSVVLTPYPEDGKIVTVVASLMQMQFQLQVLAVTAAARPARDSALVLTDAPERFKATNFITDATEGFRNSDGVLFDISARWMPARDEGGGED